MLSYQMSRLQTRKTISENWTGITRTQLADVGRREPPMESRHSRFLRLIRRDQSSSTHKGR